MLMRIYILTKKISSMPFLGNMLAMRTGLSGLNVNDGQLTSYTYDRLGNMLTLTDAMGLTELFEYGLAGLMTEKTDRNGNVTTCPYPRNHERCFNGLR